MSCYSPLLAIPNGVLPDGKKKMAIVSLKKKYNSIDKKKFPDLTFECWYRDLIKYQPDAIIVPCGKCLGCRLDYSRKWSDRMMMELESQGKGIFLTVTYDDDHVPILFDENDFPLCPTLCKKDISDFMKRLRKAFDGKQGRPGPLTIRFYASGEYGENTGRPHGHLILFGIGIEDFQDTELAGINELKQEFYTSRKLFSIWKNGNVYFSEVSYATCAYVARYCMKKVGADSNPYNQGEEQEFSLMSRCPGIGVPYLEKHPELYDYQNVYLTNGKQAAIPRLFIEKLPESERKEEIMKQRKELANDAVLYRLQQNPLGLVDQLDASRMDKEQRTKVLYRSLNS